MNQFSKLTRKQKGKRTVSKKDNNIRLIQRDFPLPSHKDARMAAEAAECADEQGKFWDYAELLFSNQQSLGDQNLQEYATLVGLNRKQFRDCLHGGRQRQEVDKDIADAKMAGISNERVFSCPLCGFTATDFHCERKPHHF